MRLARLFSAFAFFAASAVSAQVLSANGAVVSTEPAASSRHEGLPVDNNTYGTTALTWVTLAPWDFHPVDTLTTYGFGTSQSNGTFGIYRTGGTCCFEAGLHLPEGAVVSVIEIAGCDTNAAANLSAYFNAILRSGAAVVVPGLVNTTGATGCQDVSTSITPFTVNNDTTYYTVEVNFGSGTDATLILNSVRVGYKLQISPDPLTATFADVPVGSLYHRFVEALAAAGITGGCGGGNYCPDAPITRGQMAVFLSAALGLHWAP
jgi:S-layer homology domain